MPTLFKNSDGSVIKNANGSLRVGTAANCCCDSDPGDCNGCAHIRDCTGGTDYEIPCDELPTGSVPGDVLSGPTGCFEIIAMSITCGTYTSRSGETFANCGQGCASCNCECYPLSPCRIYPYSCCSIPGTEPNLDATLATGLTDSDVGSIVVVNGRCYTVLAKTLCSGNEQVASVTPFVGDCTACLAVETNIHVPWSCPGNAPQTVTVILPPEDTTSPSGTPCYCEGILGQAHTLPLVTTSGCRITWRKDNQGDCNTPDTFIAATHNQNEINITVQSNSNSHLDPNAWRLSYDCNSVPCSGSHIVPPRTSSRAQLCKTDPLNTCLWSGPVCTPAELAALSATIIL